MQVRRKQDASLDNLFMGLLRLHKALLDDERVAYERVHGRILQWCIFTADIE